MNWGGGCDLTYNTYDISIIIILILQHYPEPLLVTDEVSQSDSRSLNGTNKLYVTNHWSVGKRLSEDCVIWTGRRTPITSFPKTGELKKGMSLGGRRKK